MAVHPYYSLQYVFGVLHDKFLPGLLVEKTELYNANGYLYSYRSRYCEYNHYCWCKRNYNSIK